jgi:hypothetical protein
MDVAQFQQVLNAPGLAVWGLGSAMLQFQAAYTPVSGFPGVLDKVAAWRI